MVAPPSRPFRLAWIVVVFAVAAAGAACDKVALTAPTESTITLFASPGNGFTEITATVIEQAGTPVQNGTVVTFTTTIGTIEPREARTQNGRVTVRFVPGTTSGTATIRAYSGSAQSEPLELTVGAAAAARILVNVTPGSVPAGGGTVTISAVVTDEAGNRLAGVPVTFTTTAGTLLNGTVISDANGEARTTLTTNQRATVTATAGGQQQNVTIEVNAPITVSLTASTATPTTNTPVSFTVGVTVGATSVPLSNVTVDFGDGERVNLGTPTGSVTVSHVYRSPGTYTVTATATDVNGTRTSTSTQITVQASGRPLVTVTVPATVALNTVFTASVSIAQNPNNLAVDWVEFDFGDGTVKRVNSLQTTHFYTRPGSYSVRATVRFVDGTTSTGEAAIRVG